MAGNRCGYLHAHGWCDTYAITVRRGDTAQAFHHLYRARVRDDQPHFAVRPAKSITDSADGGELRFHWTSWTATHATGYGRAYPDHGSWAFTVVASAPVSGDFPFPVFTRMKLVNHVPARGTVHDTLALAYLIGDALGWGELSWMETPESGAILVRPPTPGGD